MPNRVGVNLRASAYLHQGDRKYMEDEFVVAYQRTADKKDIEYAFFGIFDGHGGKEAAHFAKDHLMDNIVSQRAFWSDDDEDVLEAIREGFIQTHMAMWKVLETWPRTASGWPSTSGSTASVAFIRKQKIYIGHVGDSAICLGYEESSGFWHGKLLTKDHKPESTQEKNRIVRSGGKVVNKSGVPRVVWNRPKRGHKGPVRRSTPMDEIPFLAVARSLGDLWSYNPNNNQFVVSPVPDVHVHPIDIDQHRCLIFGTDGLWNVMSPYVAVNIAYCTEKNNENHYLGILMPCGTQRLWVNPSRSVVKGAMDRYSRCNLRADNTSAVVVFLDPPGRPKREVLLQRKGLANLSAEEKQNVNNAQQTSTTSSSRDCKIQVHVYNLDNKHQNKNLSPKVPNSILKIKERLPEKWQMDPSSKEQESSDEGSAFAHGAGNTPIPRSIPKGVAGDFAEQAATPGSSEGNAKKLNMITPFLSLLPTSHLCAASPISTGSKSATAAASPPLVSSHPSLRSTLRSHIDPSTASSPIGQTHSTRLSLYTSAGTPTNTTVRRSNALQKKTSVTEEVSNSVGTKASNLAGNAAACTSTSILNTNNRSLKREREEDVSTMQPQSKKNCSECGCSSSVDKGCNASSGSCNTCSLHSLQSSPKFSKLKSQENLSKPCRKGDDIQSPVISSSTVVAVQNEPSIPSINAEDANVSASSQSHTRNTTGLKLKKSTKHIAGEYGVQIRRAKRSASGNRKTRSGLPLTSSVQPENRSPSFHSAPINNNTWNNECKAGTSSRTSKRSSGITGKQEKILSSLSASRVLKSVNRGSPIEATKSENVPLKSHQSLSSLKTADSGMKTCRYAAKLNRKRRSSHSVIGFPVVDATAPPKKKSAKMHLRSGKPMIMITRSQEKTVKTIRPK